MHKNISVKYKTNIFLPLFPTIFANAYWEKDMENKEKPANL